VPCGHARRLLAFDMRHVVIAALMFAVALLVTATSATLIQQWAMARHTPYEPAPLSAIAEQPREPVEAGNPAAADCDSPTFRLGSPFRIKKAGAL
jgi:hypothetical protein